jgi:hypothetical protein
MGAVGTLEAGDKRCASMLFIIFSFGARSRYDRMQDFAEARAV